MLILQKNFLQGLFASVQSGNFPSNTYAKNFIVKVFNGSAKRKTAWLPECGDHADLNCYAGINPVRAGAGR